MKKSRCAPAAGKRIFSSDRLNCVSMKVRVNMSELRRDIRGKTAEGNEWGRNRNANALEEGRSTLSNPP